MSTPNTPDNSKGKQKADDSNSPDNSKKSDSSSTSGDGNSSSSTTPRAIPRTILTFTPGANASTSFSAARDLFTGGFPRPMPPIDHNINLAGFNGLPSVVSGSCSSVAPVTLDSIFARLQEQFTKLTRQQEQLVSQNNDSKLLSSVAHAAQKKADEAAEKNKWELEKSQKRKQASDAVWKAAAKVEKDNEEEKKRLEAFELVLMEREADLNRREAELERRHAMLQQLTGGNLCATLASVGRTGSMQRSRDPMSNDGDLSSSSNLLPHNSSAMFESAVDDPPRGRTLSSPHILQHQLLSTTPSDLAFRSRSNRFSPIRPRPVIPRRGSSANLSIATPTPLRVRRDADLRRIAAFGTTPDDVYDSSGEENAGESSSGGEEQVEVQVEEAERPRGRSVRRVSRNENLRREA